MNVLTLRDRPSDVLGRALAEFERQFTYPLGPGRTFRLSHGDDYPRFFRAMGEGRSFVLENDGQVHGSLGVARRSLILPDGRTESVAYLGDLKVEPAARKALGFLRLARAAQEWARPWAAKGFGVVMDGTSATPDAYTGRFGIPAIRKLGSTLVWQFRCKPSAGKSPGAGWATTSSAVEERYRTLSRGRYACPGADLGERSLMTPVWLMAPEGQACGVVEDTRRCKRLLADDGEELRSAHLSFFAWQSPAAGAALLQAACAEAARAGHPALFVAVAPSDVPALEAALGRVEKVVAPATIFGHGFDEEIPWNINTSEI